MTSYFLRFTRNAEKDIERGYSFVGYQLWATEREALEALSENTGAAYEDGFEFEAWAEANAHRVGQDNVTELWGTRRSGLCGYGKFATVEEALEAASDLSDQYSDMGALTMFEGVVSYDSELDGGDDGQTFRPLAVVMVIAEVS